MTTRLFLGRPLPGVVGETRRLVHVFELTQQDLSSDRLVAMCAASFSPGQLELIDRPMGLPCESCLRRTPSAAPELPSDTRPSLPLSSDGK